MSHCEHGYPEELILSGEEEESEYGDDSTDDAQAQVWQAPEWLQTHNKKKAEFFLSRLERLTKTTQSFSDTLDPYMHYDCTQLAPKEILLLGGHVRVAAGWVRRVQQDLLDNRDMYGYLSEEQQAAYDKSQDTLNQLMKAVQYKVDKVKDEFRVDTTLESDVRWAIVREHVDQGYFTPLYPL